MVEHFLDAVYLSLVWKLDYSMVSNKRSATKKTILHALILSTTFINFDLRREDPENPILINSKYGYLKYKNAKIPNFQKLQNHGAYVFLHQVYSIP